ACKMSPQADADLSWLTPLQSLHSPVPQQVAPSSLPQTPTGKTTDCPLPSNHQCLAFSMNLATQVASALLVWIINRANCHPYISSLSVDKTHPYTSQVRLYRQVPVHNRLQTSPIPPC